MKKWYAVQHGDDFDCGYGSTVKREAIKMANAMKRDPYYDGEEIRIAITGEDDDFVYDVIIVRDGEDDDCEGDDDGFWNFPAKFPGIEY